MNPKTNNLPNNPAALIDAQIPPLHETIRGIGRCQWCGLVSHDLVDESCPVCYSKIRRINKRG